MAEARQRSADNQKHTPIFDVEYSVTVGLTTKQEPKAVASEFTVKIKKDQKGVELSQIFVPKSFHQTPGLSPARNQSRQGEYYSSKSTEMSHKRHPVHISRELSERLHNSPFNVHPLFHWNDGKGGSQNFNDSWAWHDPKFVKLPLSKHYVKNVNGNDEWKWNIISEELTKLKSIFDSGQRAGHDLPHHIGSFIHTVVSTYNNRATRGVNFAILDTPDLRRQLISTLPIIVEFACMLEHELGNHVPILTSGSRKSIYITQNLACSILANAFFCTFPDQSKKLPSINFNRLFEASPARSSTKIEKLECILNYFQQMKRKHISNNNIISYEKRQLTHTINWKSSDELLCSVNVHSNGLIEDASKMLQVDFANKFIGGGILSDGMVQEEIRFSICPELIIARLFTEELDDNEVLVITGCERFSKYSGYGPTFKFEGTYKDNEKTDKLGRRYTQIVAMDAYRFKAYEKLKQYGKALIDRELNKCFCAFNPLGKHASSIATGNWGCGAFNGDSELKFLIQWMAASQAKRDLHFYTFGNKEQSKSLIGIINMLKGKGVTVGKLYKAVTKYEKEIINSSGRHTRESVFDFVKSYCNRSFWSKIGL